MPKDIQINNNDEFFVAVCNTYIHSYLVAGVKQIDKEGVAHFKLLASAGRYFNLVKETKVKGSVKAKETLKATCGHVGSFLDDEHLVAGPWDDSLKQFKFPRSRKAKYSAYTINLDQYLKLVDVIVTVNPEIGCYRIDPADKQKHNPILKYGFADGNPQEYAKFKKKFAHLNVLSNNCRTGALDIIDEAAKLLLSKQVTKNVLAEMPLPVRFHDGVADYLFILPVAIDVKNNPDLHPVIASTLAKIYHRLDDMLTKAKKSEATKQKFELLKGLYNELLNTGKQDIQAFKTKIDAFLADDDNKKILYQTREPNVFGRLFKPKSSTENMFVAINKKLDRRIKQAL